MSTSNEQTHTSDAWIYTDSYPKGLKKGEQRLPSNDDAKSIVLRTHACALNPVDIQMMNVPRKGKDKGKEWGIVNDFSGTVVKATGFAEGDQVFGMTMSPFSSLRTGSLARTAVLEPSVTTMTKKPSTWTHAQACAIPLVWLTAKSCVEDVAPFVEAKGLTAERRVAVLGGSSAVGMYAILLAKQRGWRVLATSSERNKSFLEQELHVDQHVDYTKEDVRQGVTAFQPHAIIDCVGGTEAVGVRGNRRYISIVGDKTSREAMGGPYTYYDWRSPRFAAAQWIRWLKGVVGLGESYDVIHLALKGEWLDDAVKTLTTDKIFIDSTFPFDEADKAFARLNTGRAKGKVVVQVSSADNV